MAGHVFVTQGDLTALACSAWLLPGNEDDGPGTRREWLTHTSGIRDQFDGERLRSPIRVAGLERIWRLRRADDPRAPQVYLMNSGGHHGLRLSWYLGGLEEFLTALRQDGDQWKVGVNRERPLVGIPMFGTGEGGADQTRGGIVKAALERLYAAGDDPAIGADFVLVTKRDDDFAAAQWGRRTIEETFAPWRELGDELVGVADRLSAEAGAGRLVLFIGAGVSVAAGLPSWSELILELAELAHIPESTRAKLVEELPAVDQARIIESYLGGDDALGLAVADLMAADRPSLGHTLLAALPVREVVTTNYDRLFELASAAAGRPTAVLPYAPDPALERWLLKLHGSVTNPRDIVLTRDDYLSYHTRRGALAGIVQGLLITKHMLFVGFSFSDDNFHRIVHDVRSAIRPEGGRQTDVHRFGTALLLDDDELRRRLFARELEFATTVDPTATSSPLRPARRAEIFLDCLLSRSTTNTPHLLDRTYDELLTEEERQLRERFNEFMLEAAPSGHRTPPAWSEFEALARRLGARDSHAPPG